MANRNLVRPRRTVRSRTRRRSASSKLRLLLRLLVVAAFALGGACSSTQGAGVRSVTLLGPGVINDPKNKSLRFDILKYGLKNFCDEMLQRGVALKLSDDHPVVGRFFGRDCKSDMIDAEASRSLIVRFSGLGYVWTNLTRRVGVDVHGTVELLPDFQLSPDSSMYVYFRTKRVELTQFELLLVELTVARTATNLPNLDPQRIGQEILQAQLNRGFTVIRLNESGQCEFGAGLLPLGQHPFQPFKVSSDDPVFVNERTEIHRGQQDYIGVIKVDGPGKALGLAVSVDGAPAVNVAVVSGNSGQQLIDRYVHVAGPAGFLEPPRFVQDVAYGSLWRQTIPVPEGTFYILFQQPSAPSSQVQAVAGDDRAAKVDCLVQVVDAH